MKLITMKPRGFGMLVLLLALFHCPDSLKAQGMDSLRIQNLSLSYFGETFTHPGGSIGYERSFKSWKRIREKKSGKIKEQNLILLAESRLAFYHHRRNHNALLGFTGASIARLKPNGTFFKLGLQTGLVQRFYNAPVYTVETGIISRTNSRANIQFAYGLATSLGHYKMPGESGHPISWFVRSNIYFSRPFSTSHLLQNALELGLVYTWYYG